MNKRITLHNSPTGWLATFVGDADMIAAFGTDTIPTAYTAQANGLDVAKAIAAKNPGFDIIVTATKKG